MDQCDGIADRLDELEEQSVPLDELLPHYNRLVVDLSFIQDLLDDLPRETM